MAAKSESGGVAPIEQSQTAPTTDKTMKAVRFHGKEDIRLENIPEPVCGKGQVKVRPAWCGICGSDLHVRFQCNKSRCDLG